MTVKIFTVAHVPADLQQSWLQHLRDFDTAHPGCHFEVLIDAPDASFAEIVHAVRVEPGLSFTQYFERTKPVSLDPNDPRPYWEQGKE